jgi:short-subunit dehydrogenase
MGHETVVVTGASSGIGRELAKCFAADGSRLVLVARSGTALQSLAEELRKLHKTDALVFTIDLARPEAAPQLQEQLQVAGFKTDVLVNNAGFGAQGMFAGLPLDRQLKMLQLNVVTLTHLTRLLLPGMIERKRGGVLNVASTAAFQAGPGMGIYYASKAYVLSFSEALAEELAGTGVTATALCPGPTETGFLNAGGIRASRLFRMSSMPAEAVARIGHDAFRNGRAVAIAGFRNQSLAFAVRFVPRALARKLAGRWNAAK